MNKLENKWQDEANKRYIYTKHNCLDVYNSEETRKSLYDKAKQQYIKTDKIIKNDIQFNSYYESETQNNKKIIDNEINLILKKSEEYKKFKSNCSRINKYKSKAFELLTKEIYNKFGVELNNENTFINILNEIEEKVKINPNNYLVVSSPFSVFPLNNKNKKGIKQYSFKLNNSQNKINLDLCFKLDDMKERKYKFANGEIISKKLLDDDKIYLFEIHERTPVFRLKRDKNIFFYSSDGEITYKIKSNFDIIAKEEHINKDFKPSLKFYVKSTFKDFLINYYIKSDFLISLEKINKSHHNFRLKHILKQFNYNKRPDLWKLENGELIFFEMKFKEFTELHINDIENTFFYIQEFNKICRMNKINKTIKHIKLIHINNIIPNNIKIRVQQIIKNNNIYIELIKLTDIIDNLGGQIPNKIKVSKNKNKTMREMEWNLNPNNIIIDLTRVT